MKWISKKWLNGLVVLSSFIGYLEWGTSSSTYLIEGEWLVLKGLLSDAGSVAHPFTLLPLLGQVLLLITLFQAKPSRWLTITGVLCIAVLMVLVFAIGLMSGNVKIIVCALPFLIFGTLAVLKKQNPGLQ